MLIGYSQTGSGANQIRCKYLTIVANQKQENIEVFFFRQEDVNIRDKTINGLQYDIVIDKFVRKTFPYPDIIDCGGNAFPQKPVKASLRSESIFIHNRFGGKMAVYNMVKDSPCAKYFIEACKYEDVDMNELLDTYGEIIIKPVGESLGQGIYKISKNGNNYNVHFKHNNSTVSAEEFRKTYDPKFKDGKHIIQEYFDSKTSHGNPFDIRVIVCRGKDGKWNYSEKFARIGHPEGVVSNLAAGGYIIAKGLDSFLEMNHGNNFRQINAEINYIIDNVPEMIQSVFPYLICQIGFDIGINIDGKIKFFEINGNPIYRSDEFNSAIARIGLYKYLYSNKSKILQRQKNTDSKRRKKY